MANFVYTLSKNDVNSATRCFQFAKLTHEKGHTVNIFFIDDIKKFIDVDYILIIFPIFLNLNAVCQ